MDIYVHGNPLIVRFLLLLFLCLNTGSVKSCMEEERRALLTFKQHLTDLNGRLSSWIGHECCRWRGISCNNHTGHVAMLDLRYTYTFSDDQHWNDTEYVQSFLGGKLNPCLLGLKHLTYLDLSNNEFQEVHIPNFFGQLTSLRYLNLSQAFYYLSRGEIPPSIGNLSNLNYLDLNSINNLGFSSKNLNWLSHLSSLKYLNLGGVDLSSIGVSWLYHVNMLRSLLELHLYNCQIQNRSLSLQSVNFTSLLVLDLSSNHIDEFSIPSWFFNLTSLKSLKHLDLSNCGLGQLPKLYGNLCNLKSLSLPYNHFDGAGILEFMSGFSNCSYNKMESLDLSRCGLVGELPTSLGMLKCLQNLDLSFNFFWGSIPDSIGNLSSLKRLDLSENSMNGSILESLGQLFQLVNLHLSADLEMTDQNCWQGILTEAHFINLTSLESFRVSTKQPMSLIFNMAYDWVPPFKLHTIFIMSCRVGPAFPIWLQSQTQLVDVTLRNTGKSGAIPEDWLMKISSRVQNFDLSYNQIRGKLPLQYKYPHLTSIDLSHNQFEGTLQLSPSNVPVLGNLFLSDNNLEGTIPTSICDMQYMVTLSLRNNQFFGEFPQEWGLWRNIEVVDVSHNNLSGYIPSSMGIPSSLEVLKINNNKFGGEIPFSLQNCSQLRDIDLGGNKLTGKLPSWIGSKLPELQILQLRSNFLSGHIPKQLCNLQGLHILDLGHNNFSGTIPTCLNNLTSLVTGVQDWKGYGAYHEQTTIISKGRELEYSFTTDVQILIYVTSIDLSSNNLEGEVPKEIWSLIALGSLNLSRNQLTGTILSMIGNLTRLESLDLSHNHLSGEIPQSISSLNFLSHLNLSCNNLCGRIPMGNQLQTLDDPSIYKGNPSLCGFPLNKCPGNDIPSEQPFPAEYCKDHEDDNKKLVFYTSAVLSFVIGFWGVCGTLILNKSWRYAYFQFFDNMKDKVALAIALKVVHYQREV